MSAQESVHISPENREFQTVPNTDATGKDWVIFRQRGTALYFVRPEPVRTDAVIPALVDGRFTKVELAQSAIERYLELNWKEAALAKVKTTRTSEAEAEQRVREIQAAVDAENAKLAVESKSQVKRLAIQSKAVADGTKTGG